MAVRRFKVSLTCPVAALLMMAVLTLASCNKGAAAGHGGSAAAMSSAGNLSSAIAPSRSSTTSIAMTKPGVTAGSTVIRTRAATGSGDSRSTFTAASSGSAVPKAIGGTTWLLVRAVVGGRTYDSPQPPGSSVYRSYTMQFVNGELLANDGCNTLEVKVWVDAHTVTSSTDVTSTGVACRTSALREAYDGELFRVSVGWTVSGNELTLITASGDTFKFEPSPQATAAAATS